MTLIKEMQLEYVSQVHEIEKESFFENIWTPKAFIECMERKEILFYVIKLKDEIAGYIIIQLTKPEASILNLAIKKEYRRKGYASKLINYVTEKLKNDGYFCSFLEVRKTNISARNLYIKAGFQFLNVRKKYYKNGEDAIVLIKYLSLHNKDRKIISPHLPRMGV